MEKEEFVSLNDPGTEHSQVLDVSTRTQTMLMDSIRTQIRQRMTVRKLLYSIVSGKKKEYDKLKLLKKISSASRIAVNS